MKEKSFTFSRERGVVWVCDIRNSSKYLNDNESARAIEEFLPRLHWLSKVAVRAAGGQFVKWTGDGFLGWFPIELHRDLGPQAARVLRIIWHLTVINNVTRLGIGSGTVFRLGHGLTMEHDALRTNVSDEEGAYFDLIGRSVVLAFRLSGITARFPGIVSQKEVVEATAKEDVAAIRFQKLHLSADDRRRYFKGERWGTGSLFVSAERRPRKTSKSVLLRSVRRTIARAEGSSIQTGTDHTVRRFMEDIESGPSWAQDVLGDYIKFLREGLLGTLKVAERALVSSDGEPAR